MYRFFFESVYIMHFDTVYIRGIHLMQDLFLELVACDICHKDKYWIRAKNVGAEVTFFINVHFS